MNSKMKHLFMMYIGELKAALVFFFFFSPLQDECKMIKVVERKDNFW